MARLAYLETGDLPEEDRPLLNNAINLTKILVHSPGLARGVASLSAHIRKGSRLDARLREIATLMVGWLAKSPYEWSHHVKIGRDVGVSDEDILAIMGRAAAADPVAAVVMDAAREIYGAGLSDETYLLLGNTFDSERLVDLVFVIALYCGIVRMLEAMQIDVEPEYQPYLDAFPMPV